MIILLGHLHSTLVKGVEGRWCCRSRVIGGRGGWGVNVRSMDMCMYNLPLTLEIKTAIIIWLLFQVFQKRFNGSVEFRRKWSEYQTGFGHLDGGEFWLGKAHRAFKVNTRYIQECCVIPANTKHLYNICTTSARRFRRWPNIVQMLYKCFCVCWVL